MFEHIMVPYDKSEPANKALEFAIDLAKKYSSKISVVTYVPSHLDYSQEGASYVETIQIIKKTATYSLAKLEPKLQQLGIPYELKVVEGISITETLVSYADMHHVDVIVMGSRGLGGFKKLMLGSVASGVTQHSKCPVLIVK
ncbi:MAG: universal stress protein [Thaumarchaeota archaeon]|nr:universal stress protein [Nitrososphaerota archaeon]